MNPIRCRFSDQTWIAGKSSNSRWILWSHPQKKWLLQLEVEMPWHFFAKADSNCLLGNLWHHRLFEANDWVQRSLIYVFRDASLKRLRKHALHSDQTNRCGKGHGSYWVGLSTAALRSSFGSIMAAICIGQDGSEKPSFSKRLTKANKGAHGCLLIKWWTSNDWYDKVQAENTLNLKTEIRNERPFLPGTPNNHL